MFARLKKRSMRITASSFFAAAFMLAGCAPTIHLDAPAMPALGPQQADAQQCTAAPALNTGKTEKEKSIAALDPPPQLPDVDKSLLLCPPGSGFLTCFTPDQEAIRQKRFKILHDDRDYCRDAYDRAVKRVAR
jgi:hypothetical protein